MLFSSQPPVWNQQNTGAFGGPGMGSTGAFGGPGMASTGAFGQPMSNQQNTMNSFPSYMPSNQAPPQQPGSGAKQGGSIFD
jgi:hypothetical protein